MPKVIPLSWDPLELLHMDLFGSSRTPSLGEKTYVFVIVDDFSRYTWVLFLSQKNEAFYEFSKFCNKVQNEKILQLLI